MTRGCIAAAALSAFLAASVAPASAEGTKDFPCVDCGAYDYGWLEASKNGFSNMDDCEYEVNDRWDREFVEGCMDYVRYRQRLRLSIVS